MLEWEKNFRLFYYNMTREKNLKFVGNNGCANKEIITNSQISTLFVVGEKHMQIICRTKLMMREFFMQIF
jgi:hypothetical protein